MSFLPTTNDTVKNCKKVAIMFTDNALDFEFEDCAHNEAFPVLCIEETQQAIVCEDETQYVKLRQLDYDWCCMITKEEINKLKDQPQCDEQTDTEYWV